MIRFLLRSFAIWILMLASFTLAALLVPIAAVRKLLGIKGYSLWAGTPIINMAVNARAERLLGRRTISLVYNTYFITSEFDVNLSRICGLRFIGKVVPFMIFPLAVPFVDRIHIYCDKSLLPPMQLWGVNFLELKFWKLIGVRLFAWTYGADVRTQAKTRSLGEFNACIQCPRPGTACVCDDVKQRIYFQRLSSVVDQVFSMGDMIEYTPTSRNDLFFWPVDFKLRPDKYSPTIPSKNNIGPMRIVHAPNHRAYKGTQFLIDVVQALKAEGEKIELILVEGMPNEKALEIYKTADLIFDQCIIGFHGYFAIEAMALGKPVMCFIRYPEKYLLFPEECPIINVSVGTLKQQIRHFARNREQLVELGIRGADYTRRYYSLEAFSNRLKTAYIDLGLVV